MGMGSTPGATPGMMGGHQQMVSQMGATPMGGTPMGGVGTSMGTSMGQCDKAAPGNYTTNSTIEGMSNLMGRINEYGQMMNCGDQIMG